MGFTKGNQVRLYGDVFELVGEPIAITDTLVLLYGTDKKSGQLRRIRVPLPIMRVRTDTILLLRISWRKNPIARLG